MVIPSAAHLSNVEQAEAFNKALTKFYDRGEGLPHPILDAAREALGRAPAEIFG